MSYKDEIIDYNLHQEEINKWIMLKGEQKYMRFVALLKQNNVNVKWNTFIDTAIELKDNIYYKNFSFDNLNANKELLIELRNRVSHNKIILESAKNGCNINQMLVAFKNTLPLTYQNGFVKDINACIIDLKIPRQLTMNI